MIDRWSKGWRVNLLISGCVSGATLMAMHLAKSNPVATGVTREVTKLAPTLEAVKPVATAILAKATPIATQVAPKIVEHISRFDRLDAVKNFAEKTPDYQILINGVGTAAAIVLGAIVIFKIGEGIKWIKENYFEHDIQISSKRKIKGPVQDIAIVTKDPKLAKALITETGEELDISVDGLPLPVAATLKAIDKVLEFEPETKAKLLQEMQSQETDLKRRAGRRF